METELIRNVDIKIINGNQVIDDTKHPHQVWILLDNSYFCGGNSIIFSESII